MRFKLPTMSLRFSLEGLLAGIAILSSLLFCLISCVGIKLIIRNAGTMVLPSASVPAVNQNFEQNCIVLMICCCILICFAGVGASILSSLLISRPLTRLAESLSKLRNLELEEDLGVHSRIKEVIQMQLAIDDLKSGLKSFRRYVPSELVAGFIKQRKEAVLGAEKRVMTIYFSDIADFAVISERLSPEQLVSELSVYFDGMTRTIMNNHGTIDKYIGDTIMAFWGAPEGIKDHAGLACLSALECMRYAYGISREWVKKGLPPLQTRVGLHTGEVLVGNIGYPERLNYTVMGDNVNIASRLEGLNKYYGTEILISGPTYEQARDLIEARLLDMVVVKGRNQPIPVYELVAEKGGIGSEWVDFYRSFDLGMQQYLARRWPEARELFYSVHRMNPKDRPAEIMLKRCTAYVKNPPPRDWCGEVVMREK
jgi:adenylate cyclase